MVTYWDHTREGRKVDYLAICAGRVTMKLQLREVKLSCKNITVHISEDDRNWNFQYQLPVGGHNDSRNRNGVKIGMIMTLFCMFFIEISMHPKVLYIAFEISTITTSVTI